MKKIGALLKVMLLGIVFASPIFMVDATKIDDDLNEVAYDSEMENLVLI